MSTQAQLACPLYSEVFPDNAVVIVKSLKNFGWLFCGKHDSLSVVVHLIAEGMNLLHDQSSLVDITLVGADHQVVHYSFRVVGVHVAWLHAIQIVLERVAAIEELADIAADHFAKGKPTSGMVVDPGCDVQNHVVQYDKLSTLNEHLNKLLSRDTLQIAHSFERYLASQASLVNDLTGCNRQHKEKNIERRQTFLFRLVHKL